MCDNLNISNFSTYFKKETVIDHKFLSEWGLIFYHYYSILNGNPSQFTQPTSNQPRKSYLRHWIEKFKIHVLSKNYKKATLVDPFKSSQSQAQKRANFLYDNEYLMDADPQDPAEMFLNCYVSPGKNGGLSNPNNQTPAVLKYIRDDNLNPVRNPIQSSSTPKAYPLASRKNLRKNHIEIRKSQHNLYKAGLAVLENDSKGESTDYYQNIVDFPDCTNERVDKGWEARYVFEEKSESEVSVVQNKKSVTATSVFKTPKFPPPPTASQLRPRNKPYDQGPVAQFKKSQAVDHLSQINNGYISDNSHFTSVSERPPNFQVGTAGSTLTAQENEKITSLTKQIELLTQKLGQVIENQEKSEKSDSVAAFPTPPTLPIPPAPKFKAEDGSGDAGQNFPAPPAIPRRYTPCSSVITAYDLQKGKRNLKKAEPLPKIEKFSALNKVLLEKMKKHRKFIESSSSDSESSYEFDDEF